MKLIIFISSLASGGAERVTVNLANHWVTKGWEVIIVTLTSQSEDFYELSPAVKRIALKLDGDSSNALIGLTQNLRRIFVLRRVLRQTQPGIAMAMMTGANILLALASWGLTQVRTVGSERIYPPQCPLGIVWEWLRCKSYGLLGAIVAQTNEGAAWIKKHTSAQKVVVIPNPVSWPLADQLPHLDVRNMCCSGRNLLLAVGRLSSQKQFGLLINCFQSLVNRHPNWDLIILGDGPLRSALEAQVMAAELGKRVFLPGRAGNVGDWYERADLYVMSSLFEGFPNTLVEAMAYGLPVVSFDCDTGPRDIIRHDIDGLLVQSGDKDSLTVALDRLMNDPSLRQRFAGRAIDVRERFATERVADKWEGIFKEVMNG